MPDAAISTRDLTRVFERRKERGLKALFSRKPKQTLTAVDGVTLDVKKGELFGLLGPNGAGKTTLVKLLSTLLLPTSGSATVAGHDVVTEGDAVRRKIGVVLGGERALYWRLTARENLWYFAQLYAMSSRESAPRIDELLDLVGLKDRADERVEAYSKGMKQRLHIARGLLNDPEILLMDEPTIGLDPHAGRTLRALVRDLVERRKVTVVLTTHYMYEADALSDRVAVINKGRVVALDSPGSLKKRYADAGAYRLEARHVGADFAGALARVPGVEHAVSQGEDPGRGTTKYRVLASKDERVAGALAAAVESNGGAVVSLAADEPTLEDVFVKLTGGTLAVDERGGGAYGDE